MFAEIEVAIFTPDTPDTPDRSIFGGLGLSEQKPITGDAGRLTTAPRFF